MTLQLELDGQAIPLTHPLPYPRWRRWLDTAIVVTCNVLLRFTSECYRTTVADVVRKGLQS